MKKNIIGSIIQGIGVVVCFIGLILTVLINSKMIKLLEELPREYEGLKEILGMYPYCVLFGCIFTGVLLLGFGEIIQLLQGIKNNGERVITEENYED